MKKVQLYKCESCGETGSRKEMVLHEKKCIKAIEEQKEAAKKRKKDNDLKNSLRLKAETPEHFAELLSSWAKSTQNEDISVSFSYLSYAECASNSHSKPIGGVTNWTRGKDSHDKGKPLGYPGLIGSIEMQKHSNGKYCGDIFDGVPGLCTGSGGGGYKSQYQVTLFLSDFPLIEKKVKEWLDLEDEKNKKEDEQEERIEEFNDKLEDVKLNDELLASLEKSLDEIRDKINKRHYALEKECEEKYNYIKIVPDSFNYDEDRFEELNNLFGKW